MNILFLDDNFERTQIAQNNLKQGIFVKTEKECIKTLKEKDHWNLVMLDHDLDEEIKDLNIVGTGMGAVNWICENKITIDLIIIHSRNYFGSSDMARILRKNRYETLQIPFFDIEWEKLKCHIQSSK